MIRTEFKNHGRIKKITSRFVSSTFFCPLDSVDPGVHCGHHRLPPGGLFRLLG